MTHARADILRILVEREGFTKDEARDYFNEVMEQVNEALEQGDICEAEDIFTSEFGLEPDYLLDLLI